MAYHVFCDADGEVMLAIVHEELETDKVGQNGACPRICHGLPGLPDKGEIAAIMAIRMLP